MATAGVAYIELRARLEQFERDLANAEKSATSRSKTIGKKFEDFGKRTSAVGRKMTMGLTLPIVGLAGLAAKGIAEGEKVAAQTEAAIKSTGGAANVTAEHVANMSLKVRELSGIDDDLVTSAQNVMLTFTKVRNEVGKGNDVFDQATIAMADMSARLGQDMQSSAIQLGKALNDPIKGVASLGRVGVQFTEEQKEQIETLTESGDVMGAQKIILAELETQFGGSAKAAGDTFGGKMAKAKFAMEEATESIVVALMPALTGLAEKIAKAAEWFQNLSPGVKRLILVIGGLVAVAGPVVGAIGAISAALGFLAANPIVLVIAAVVGLTVLIVKNWDKIKKVTEKVFGAIGDFLSSTWEAIKNTTADIVGGVLAWLTNRFADFLSFFVGIAGGIVDAAAKAFGWVPGIGDKIKRFQRDFHESTQRIIGNVRSQAREFQSWGEKSSNAIQSVAGQFGGLQNAIKKGVAPQAIRAEDVGRGVGGGIGAGPLGTNLVSIGRNLQAQGFRVGEHPAFGGVQGGHASGSYHYIGRAIDINWGPGGTSPEEMSVLTGLGKKLEATVPGIKELLGPWNDPNHKSHLHLAMDYGGIVKGPATIHQGNITEAHIPLSGPGAKGFTISGVLEIPGLGKAFLRNAQIAVDSRERATARHARWQPELAS